MSSSQLIRQLPSEAYNTLGHRVYV